MSAVGLAVARDGLIVAASSDGAIEVFDHGYRQRLVAPGGRLDRLTSRRTSRYLLATTAPTCWCGTSARCSRGDSPRSSPAATFALAAALGNATPNDTGDAVTWR
ncbi:MAG TPA: hypothetical protein VF516_48185 [Kofleriaceae bacterium]